MTDCAAVHRYHKVNSSGVHELEDEVPTEMAVTVFVNGQELVSLMCTPCDQESLALGFMLNEGLIARPEDVRLTHTCARGDCVDVWLDYDIREFPKRRTITTGCVGGVTFDDLSATHPPLESTLAVTPAQLHRLMRALQEAAKLYRRAGGVHTSGLCRGEELLLVAEDVGRHNTLDKLRGLAFREGVDTRDCVLLTTGRISSEMLNKARCMETPIVASRTSPTSLSVLMAKAWNITLVGYMRRIRMSVYSHPWRLGAGDGSCVETPLALRTNGNQPTDRAQRER